MSVRFRSLSWFAIRLSIAIVIAATFVLRPSGEDSVAIAQSAPLASDTVWISATGQTISGAFLSYWIDHPEIGNPISGMVDEHGLLSQWFEFARLELEPVPFEQATKRHVHRHQIGRSFAIRAGYTESLSAFKPLSEGPERFFPETGHTLTMGFLSFYEQPGVAERMGLPISEEFDIGDVTYQFFEYGAFSWGPEAYASIVPLGHLDAGIHGRLAKWQPQPWNAVDWDSTGLDMMELSYRLPGERTIEVDLSDFTLKARVGDKVVLESITSIGVPQSPTVTGNFRIYLKHRIQSLSVIGWDGKLYEAPNTPWVMYFFEDYAFHPSLWRTQYGLMDSQGCVVPPMEVAEALWHWADYGTPVWIHD